MKLDKAKTLLECVEQGVNQTGDWREALEQAMYIASDEVTHLQKVEDEDEPRYYWDEMSEYGPEDSVEIVTAYGDDTCRVIDLESGGVILYCHKDNAHRIVMALRAAE